MAAEEGSCSINGSTTTMAVAPAAAQHPDGLDTILDAMYDNQFERLYHVPCFQEFCKRALLVLIFRYHNNRNAFDFVNGRDHEASGSTTVNVNASDSTGRFHRLEVVRSKNTLLYAKRHQSSKQQQQQQQQQQHQQQQLDTQIPRTEEAKFVFPLFGGNGLNCYLQFPFTIESQDFDFACIPTQHYAQSLHTLRQSDTVFHDLNRYVTAFQQNLIKMIRRRFIASAHSSSATPPPGPSLGMPYVELLRYPDKQKCSLVAVLNNSRRVHVGDFQLMQHLNYQRDQQIVYNPQLHFRHESSIPFLPWICCVTETRLAALLYESATHNNDPARRAMDQRRLAYMQQVCRTWGARYIWSSEESASRPASASSSVVVVDSHAKPESDTHVHNPHEGHLYTSVWHRLRTTVNEFIKKLDAFERIVHSKLVQVGNKHTDNQQHIECVLGPHLKHRHQKQRVQTRKIQQKVNKLQAQVQEWEKCKHTYEYYAHVLGYEEIKKLLDNILSLRQFHPRYDSLSSATMDANYFQQQPISEETPTEQTSDDETKQQKKESSAQRRRRRQRKKHKQRNAGSKKALCLSTLLEKAKESLDKVQSVIHTYTERLRDSSTGGNATHTQYQSVRFSITFYLATHLRRHMETLHEWMKSKRRLSKLPLGSYMSSNGFYILRPYIDQWVKRFAPDNGAAEIPETVHRYNPWLYFAEQMDRVTTLSSPTTEEVPDTTTEDPTLRSRRDQSVYAWQLFQFHNPSDDAYVPNMTLLHNDDDDDDDDDGAQRPSNEYPRRHVSHQLIRQQVHPDMVKMVNRRVQEAVAICMQEKSNDASAHRKIQWVYLLDNLLKPYMEGIDMYLQEDTAFHRRIHGTNDDDTQNEEDTQYMTLFEQSATNAIYQEIISFIPLFLEACCFLQYMLQLKEIHQGEHASTGPGASEYQRQMYYTHRLLRSDLQKAFHLLENGMYYLVWYSTRSSEYTLYGMLMHVCIAYSQRARKDLQQQQQQQDTTC
jgi:hypothetical protein